MTTYIFNTLKNSSVAFNPLNDTIIFSSSDGSASAFNMVEQTDTSGNASIEIFRLADEDAIRLQGHGELVATLTGVRLAELTGSNFIFFASSAIIGENTHSAPAIGETIATFDDTAQNITGGANDELILGLGGDDIIDSGSGNDYINGNAGNDRLVGGDGNDTVRGGQGNDTITLGSGLNDSNGNLGDDVITGDAGAELLRGGQGNDTISGGGGADTLRGNLGDDSLTLASGINQTAIAEGNEGNDTINASGAAAGTFLSINGNAGNDSIIGSGGNDSVHGGQDNDVIAGGLGADTLQGDIGDDTLRGAEGDDVLRGNAGNDVLIGNAGDDQMFGGVGDDMFMIDLTENDTEVNSVNGGEGVDTLSLTTAIIGVTPLNVTNVTGVEVLQTPAGSVTLTDAFMVGTDHGTVEISANSTAGGETIAVNVSAVSAIYSVTLSHTGSDIFQLTGSADRVLLKGGLTVSGSVGNDTIIGDSGADSITSGIGRDSLTGGAGADVFVIGATDSNAINGVDIITDFDRLTDKLNVPFDPTGAGVYAAHAGSANVIADVEGLITGAFTHVGDVQIINVTGGALNGQKFAVIDANDVDGYQSGADYLVQLSNISESLSNLILV
jgi:Ca2+-binding RTX toxin-like protein